ncbi:MAG: hypothetical protein R3E39_08510 [Anaerolineae bacterium]
MPITTSWDNADRTIIRYLLDGRWTIQDVFQAVEQVNGMLKDVSYPVDFIGEYTLSSYFVVGDFTSVFRRLETILVKQNRFPSYAVAINAPAFARNIVKIMDRIAPDITSNIFFVSSNEEACALLAKKRDREVCNNVTGQPQVDAAAS